mgnify:CR=1 FL=1
MEPDIDSSEIYALHGFHKRPATQDELETTPEFRVEGRGTKGETGILFLHGLSVTPASLRSYA